MRSTRFTPTVRFNRSLVFGEGDCPQPLSDNSGMAVCSRCGASVPDGARFCPACAAPVEDERPSEERKLATVLFADLVGSTALAGSQDPERTRAMLDRFYDAMAEEVERAGGTIEKFAGDAVMAAFGAPTALEDHAERALHAALAMQRRLAELFEGPVRGLSVRHTPLAHVYQVGYSFPVNHAGRTRVCFASRACITPLSSHS
jgi:ribosomal protein L40E